MTTKQFLAIILALILLGAFLYFLIYKDKKEDYIDTQKTTELQDSIKIYNEELDSLYIYDE